MSQKKIAKRTPADKLFKLKNITTRDNIPATDIITYTNYSS